MTGPNAVIALAILTAIPVVMFAIWVDYYGRYLDELKRDQPKYDKAPELQKIRLGGIYVTVMQVLLYLGSGPIRENHWGVATLMFLASLSIQSQLQFGLEKRIRDLPATAVQNMANGSRTMLWSVFGVMAYLMIVQIFALAGAGVAYLAGAPKETGLILTLGGGLSGILAGLGLTFAMAPVHVRKMFPSRRVEDPELDLLLKSCFARAGVAAPDFWVVESAGYRWNNAWIAGFSSGRGWFRPGLFLTESLVQGCSKEELEAIVLHEVSHVALGHLKRRFGYTLAMVGAALVLATTLMTVSLLLLPEPLLPMARIAALTAAIATPFILVRRLVERQEDEADRHAVIGLAARLDDFARALRTVDRLNNQNAVHPNTEARITRVTIAWERHLAAVKAPEAVESERRAA